MERIDYERLCMGCMAGESEPGQPCPACGFEEGGYAPAPQVLPLRTILNGKYLLGRAIGQGGFGILYLGWDLNLEMKLAIKEYFPDGFVTRDGHTTTLVSAYAGNSEAFFRSGREKFIDEAKRLARFHALPGIVSVRDYFEENGTAYIVMEFIEGETLKAYLEKQGGRLSTEWVVEKLRPLMESLAVVHQHGIIHRDISPDNIMIDELGQFRLLDFGAAREYEREGSQTILLKPGYAPYEQYQTHGEQGPWTDVYALCATIYRCITGETPAEAPRRLPKDPLQPPRELGADISCVQQAVLMKGLAIDFNERWQSVADLRQALDAAGKKEINDREKKKRKEEERAERERKRQEEKKKKTNREDIGKKEDDRSGLWRFLNETIPELMGKFTRRQWLTALGISAAAIAAVAWLMPKDGPALKDEGKAALPAAVSSDGSRADGGTGGKASGSSASGPSVVPPVSEWDVLPSGEDTTPMRQPENPDAEIEFQDAAMEFHIRNALNKPEGPITAGELAEVRQLHILSADCYINEEPEKKTRVYGSTATLEDGSPVPRLTDLTDLKYFINLRELAIPYQDFTDYTPIGELTGLTALNISNNTVGDFSPLRNLTQLQQLNLRMREGLTDISFITELVNLKVLDIGYNQQLVDITPLKALTNLESLDLRGIGQGVSQNEGSFVDISCLSALTKLHTLDMYSCNVGPFQSLAGMTQMQSLFIEMPHAEDLSFLSNMKGLQELQLFSGRAKEEQREVIDLSPLDGLAELKSLYLQTWGILELTPLLKLRNLEKLRLRDVGLRDISCLRNMTQLTYLDFWENQITDISPLSDMRELTDLNLQGNQITDISPLSDMQKLTDLNLQGNQIMDISPLSDMRELTYLNLQENQIMDISPLSDLQKLLYLKLTYNQITDISPLSNMKNLVTLMIGNNQISDLSPLRSYTALTGLWAGDNLITDWSPVAHVPNVYGRPK